MKTLIDLHLMILIGINNAMCRIRATRHQTLLMNRLQLVTDLEMDPDLGEAWANRVAVRSRLQKYVSR